MLSARLMTTPTGLPSEMQNKPPAEPPRPYQKDFTMIFDGENRDKMKKFALKDAACDFNLLCFVLIFLCMCACVVNLKSMHMKRRRI